MYIYIYTYIYICIDVYIKQHLEYCPGILLVDSQRLYEGFEFVSF